MKEARNLVTTLAVLAFAAVATSGAARAAGDTKASAAPAPAAVPAEAEAQGVESKRPDAAPVDEKTLRAERQEARRLAAAERAKERQLKQEQWERRCVIKPAMSDEEIAVCREVKTRPAP